MSRQLAEHSAEIIAAYQGGAQIAAIALKFGGTYDGVRKLLRRNSLDLKPVEQGPTQADGVAEAFNSGMALKGIAQKFGFTRWKVRYILRRRGLMAPAEKALGEPERHHNAKRLETRNCLCCGKAFNSYGIGNRLCAQHQSEGGAFV